MSLDTTSPVPLYLQLQGILRNEITRKIWAVGGKLPSEHDLCRQYGVTRPTVRQALEGLVREGLVHKHRGKGAYVTEPPLPVGLFSVTGTSDAFAAMKLKVETRLIRARTVPSCILAEGDDPAAGWVQLDRIRLVNGTPTFYEYSWLQAACVPGLEKLDLNNRSLFKTLNEQFGLLVNGGRQRFSAIAAPVEVAEGLSVRAGVPLLRLVRCMDLVKQGSSSVLVGAGRLPGALRVDLYAAQGPFVLEQSIPAATGPSAVNQTVIIPNPKSASHTAEQLDGVIS